MLMENQKDEKRVALFTAHPDDHLTCAGTLMYLKEKGFAIHEVVATGGENGPWRNSKEKNFNTDDLFQKRKEEISEASKIIGIDTTSFLGLPDGRMVKNHETVEKVVAAIRKIRPSIVFTMNPFDYHSDHRKFGKMATEGLERASWDYLPEAGKPYKVPMFLYMEGFYFGAAHILIDITRHKERKEKVIDAYASQINDSERKLLESMNTYRSFFRRDEKVLAAEAFQIPKEFPVHFDRITKLFYTD